MKQHATDVSGAFKIKFSSFISFKLSVCLCRVNILIETRSASIEKHMKMSEANFDSFFVNISPAPGCYKLW